MLSDGLPPEMSHTTNAAILIDSMSLLKQLISEVENTDWHVLMFNNQSQRPLWVYCPGEAKVKGKDQADRLSGKATIACGLHLCEPKVLRSLRHYMQAQSQGHHTTDCLVDRCTERDSTQRSSLKG